MRGKPFLLASICVLLTLLGFLIRAHFVGEEPGEQTRDGQLADLAPSEKLSPESEAAAPQKGARPRPGIQRLPREPRPEEPVWGVTIDPLLPGMYEYYFIRDGQPITDPLNPEVHQDRLARQERQSVFSYPLAKQPPAGTGESWPWWESPVPSDRRDSIRFIYRGSISRSLLFVAGFRGGPWGTDEFEPLNTAAWDNLRRIGQDQSLCRLSGVVMDAERRPISDALVRVFTYDEHLRTVRTNTLGKFTVDRLPLGYVLVEARAAMHFMREHSLHDLVSDASGIRVELVMGSGGAAAGSVWDSSGKPVPGAVVTAEWLDVPFEEWVRRARPETWADPSGRYEFPGLAPGRYAFTARASRLSGRRISPVQIVAGETTEEVDFVLASGMRIAGRVVTGTGGAERGVPGATVHASGAPIAPASPPLGIESEDQAVSGEDGWFRLERLLPGWKYALNSSLKCWRTREPVRFELADGRTPGPVIIRMPREGVIAGRVIDEAGVPVGDAAVQVEARALDDNYAARSPRRFTPEFPEPTKTDPQGRFRLGCLGDGAAYVLTIHAEGYARLPLPSVPADASREWEFVLSRGVDLTGHVVHGETGGPVRDAEIRLCFERDVDLRWDAVTGPGGEFRVRGLSPGRYLIGGRRDEAFAPLVLQPAIGFEVREGTGSEVTLKAFPPVRISGTVRDLDGAPVPHARVEFESDINSMAAYHPAQYKLDYGVYVRTACDAGGQYEVAGIRHGRLRGTAKKEGYSWGERKRDGHQFTFVKAGTPEVRLVMEPGEVRTGVDFVLQREDPAEGFRERSVRGIVLDEEGNPVGGIEVAAYHVRESMTDDVILEQGRSAITDESGRFEITGMVKKTEGLSLVPTEDRPYCGWLKETPPEDEEVTVQAIRTGSFAGIVGDARGNPVPGASVFANAPAAWDGFNRHLEFGAVADDRGIFRIPFLPPEDYEVGASMKGFHRGKGTVSRQVLQPGDTIENLVLVLYGASEFGGRLVDQDGTPLGGWEVSNNTTTDPDGMFRYELSTERRTLGFSASRQIKTPGSSNMHASVTFQTGAIDYPNETPDESREFILDLGGSITGRVVYRESREPAQGLSISIDSPLVPRVEPGSFSDCVATHFSVRASEFTGTDGSFEIDIVPAGTFSIALFGKGIAKKTIRDVVVGENQGIDLGVIEVAGGKVVTGRLIDASTGGPFDRMRYEIETQGMGAAIGLRDLPCSPPDPEGTFRITCIPDAVDTIFFIARRYRHFSPGGRMVMGSEGADLFGSVTGLDLLEADETDIGDVVLSGYRLRGRFVHHKAATPYTPPKDAFICIQFFGGNRFAPEEFYRERMEMHENGIFVFPSVRPDAIRIRLRVTSFLPVEISGPPAPDETGLIDIGDVRLDPGCTVRGSVEGPGGQPASGAFVSITDSTGNQSGGWADERGIFEISGIYPGPANLEAGARNADGENPWLGGSDGEARIKDHGFTISPGNPTTVHIQFLPLRSE